MRHLVPALVLLAFGSGALAGVEVCPTLPTDSKLKWDYKEGPDFDLCYAVREKSGAIVFGIYLGHAPDFSPQERNRLGVDTVGGRSTVWYRDDSAGGASLARQTLVTFGGNGFAHIWINAKTTEELDDALHVLRAIKFK